MLAYHYGRSDEKQKHLEYLDRGNEKARKLTAMQEAKSYFDEAMTLLDTLPETEFNRRRRISLLVNQSMVFIFLIELPEYNDLLTRYESMASTVDDLGLLGAFYARLGHCEWLFGELDRAIETRPRP
jgi:hypothetical protein